MKKNATFPNVFSFFSSFKGILLEKNATFSRVFCTVPISLIGLTHPFDVKVRKGVR